MATTAEIKAAIAKAEAAGRMDLADKLRAYLPADTPAAPARDPAQIEAAIAKAEAKGRKDLADKLRAYLPTAPTAPAPLAADGPMAPPMAPSEAEVRQSLIDEFAMFEMANPILKGRYTPETMPKADEVVMGQGGGGKSGGARYTVQPWRNVKPDTFGDTARAMMGGPVAGMKAFGAGLMDSSQSPSRDFLANDPLMGNLPGPVLTGLSKLGDAGGAGLSALGAGISGVIGLGAEFVPGANAAGERELAEGALLASQFAVPELAGASSIIGKGVTVTGKVKVPQIGTKTWRNAYGASEAKPSVESLRAAKNEAYKAVDESGEVFEAAEMGALRDTVKAELDAGNYVTGVDKQTDAVVSLLDRKAGEKMTIGQLDKLRQEFYKRLAAAPNEVGIEDAIDAIDAMIAGKADTNELMQAARLSNARYKKAETLDLAFQKAKDQTAATGSGGNILNKMRQAVVSIIDNPKRSRWYNKDEIAAMRAFVEGSSGQNAMRLFGKLSPNGNGLMMALNLGAAGGTGGASLLVTAAATGAKAIADRAAMRGADALISKVAGAEARAAPAVAPGRSVTVPVPVVPSAGQAAAPDYEGLWKRYGG
jgi:hypothetical protein